MKIRESLAALVILAFSGCASFNEGEILSKRYIPYKEGTQVIAYPPAALIGSLFLNLATTRRESYNLDLRCYNPDEPGVKQESVKVRREVYEEAREGDWYINASEQGDFEAIKRLSDRIVLDIGTKIEVQK